MTPEKYTSYYDAIVAAIREVNPQTKFVGISLAFPSFQPEFFEYFLNPKHHRPDIPLDMVAYHFYAGAGGLGGSSEKESIADWQYTFFDQAAGLLSTVRYIESIRKRLSPSTRVNLDELGTMLATDEADRWHPASAKPIPSLFWNLSGAIYAYLFVELAKKEIDVATLSGIYDTFNHVPTNLRSINVINPQTGAMHAPFHVLELIKNNFGPGDKLVSTVDPANSVEDWISELSSSNVVMQAFVTARGRKLLAINKRLQEADIDLAEAGVIDKVKLVDETSGDGPPRAVKQNGNVLHLPPFAVAVVDLSPSPHP
jgi:hypothetical protein